MSVDTLILMDHTLHVRADDIDRHLRPCLDAVDADRAFWHAHGRHGHALPEVLDDFRWQAQFGAVDNFPLDELQGPYGIHLGFGEHLVIVSPTIRWGRFVDDRDLQAVIQRFARALASCIGARHAIYLPDSASACAAACEAAYEGENMDQALLWLNTHCGPPASSISAIATWLTDEEMHREYPEWDGNEESRVRRADGYWVDTLPSPWR